MSPPTPAAAVPPEQVRLAWRELFAPPPETGEPPADPAPRAAVLLEGLPLIAAGQVDADGQPLTLRQVTAQLLGHEPAAGWQAPDGRPYLTDLARRALALGHGGD